MSCRWQSLKQDVVQVLVFGHESLVQRAGAKWTLQPLRATNCARADADNRKIASSSYKQTAHAKVSVRACVCLCACENECVLKSFLTEVEEGHKMYILFILPTSYL